MVIEAKLDRNFLVLAPPGTGKTYTLIERLIFAITKSFRKIDASELLVLSFTRSAVGEIRERIAAAIENGAPNSLRYVQVKTFDSYATWLLSDGGYDISGNTYDERIRLLASELKHIKLRQKTDRIARSRYLFVDEIQDLVGVRADLVFELVKRILASKGSVTLLGDPHQSLNDYQVGTNQTDSAEFLEKVQNLLAGGLERFELKESYRYKTPEMKAIAYEAQKILDNNELPASQKFKMLIQLIPEVSQDSLIKNFKEGSIDALLCRSNCEVFQWLNWHQKQGNLCTVNVGALDRPWPAWYGQAIMHYQSKVMTLEQLINRLSNNVRNGLAPSEEELVKFLTKEQFLKRNIINLEDLAFQLKYLSPTINSEQTNDGLIVSTVHKAKGLEYKNVVVVWPNKEEEVTDEEVRVLYVAITRAKCSISLLPKNMTPFSSRLKKKKGGHMGYAEAGIKYLQVVGLEDFDLETLFINEMGGVDTCNLENYLHTYHEDNNYSIRPESFNAENDHIYALYLNSSLGLIRLCAVDKKMKSSLDAMSWGNKYGKDGALLDIGKCFDNQTIVHPMESLTLARHIGPAGIMVFPIIQGFYPISRATGE
ncbi:UvrD-helicase domain-containing protein [Shewanella sp. SM96]|uniref:UvrD-helicase domain-containing protein n=1 Tax=Shewanella sp. SM96 TaxID=2912813 RepID=UPI0021D8A1DE|nr:UvrD-helicase domain-containing protein [Shewanella sp. SM96]